MKLDQLIGYFNTGKINLIPGFQRSHVWRLPARQRLLVNMVSGRPIPAVFLYKDEAGSQFSYNIVDGKQRLESLILFVGNARHDLQIPKIKDFFANDRERNQIDFSISLDGEKKSFQNLDQATVREFREYAIPTIEITLDGQTSLDEIINLFVDINQTGEKVKRFDIIKAIGKDSSLLRTTLGMVATQRTIKKDKIFKPIKSAYTRVLSRLQIIAKASGDDNLMVDLMWERLVEIVLFNRTQTHRQPGQILKAFIKGGGAGDDMSALKSGEKKRLNGCFNFLDKAYKETRLGDTRLARDLPHFYTMVTTLLSSDLLEGGGAPPDYPQLRAKLIAFADLLPEDAPAPKSKALARSLDQYLEAAGKQTTHPGRRKTRQEKLLELVGNL